MSVLMPPEPEDPVLFHDRRAPIDLDPGGPVAVEPVELPEGFFRELIHDSGLAWILLEPERGDAGTVTGWHGVRLGGSSPAYVAYPGLAVPDGVTSYRLPLLPEALRQLDAPLRRVLRDGVGVRVRFRVTEGARIAHYSGWCFGTRGGVGLAYRDASTDRPGAGASRGESLVDEAQEAADMGSFQWLVDVDVVELSPSAAPLLGMARMPADLDLARLLERVEPGDRTRVERTLRSAAQLGTAFRSRFQTSATPPAPGVPAREGRTIRQIGRPVMTAGRVRIVGVIEDITDSYQAELAFSRAQRLASLAMLSAGIAHDFNNVLTVITMRADMMRESIAAGDPAITFDEDAEAILEAANRASGLTRQLMLFAGHQSGEPRTLRPAEVLDELRTVVDNLSGTARTEWTLSPTAPVMADRSQFEQIILNLAVNAREAVEDLGADGAPPPVVSIVSDEQTAGNPLVAARTGASRHPRWVHLQVSDTGRGMTAETLARACDPFFTTKTRGRGTGLGLSVVFGILEQLGGWLDIDSTVGLGTTVDVFIPPAPGSAAAEGGDCPQLEAPARRAQLIVVDDDPAARLVTSRTLTHAGYSVLVADSGQGCLDLLAAHPDVMAVVSDVVMPEMDGTELTRRILAEYPDTPVLLVTGFTPPTDVLGHPRLALLTKPLTALQLASALRRLVQLSAAQH